MNMFSKNSPARSSVRSPFFAGFPSLWNEELFNQEFAGFVPAVNISQNENEWKIEVSAAGFSKDEFKVTLENELLTISAEHKVEDSKEEKNYSRREFRKGAFSRSFRIGKGTVKDEAVVANYENGILSIVLPKMKEEQKNNSKVINVA